MFFSRKLHLSVLLLNLILCSCFHAVYGQTGGSECNQAKMISIPLIRDSAAIKSANAHVINQSNSYEQTDQFSYWYKLNIESDAIINCQITPINKNDKYVVYIYKYRGEDFCEKLSKGKIKHARVENEENKKSIIEASESSDFEFDAFKDDKFYFSILNVSQNNCGHKLRLIVGGDTLKITAPHSPCIGLEKEKPAVTLKAVIKQTADTISSHKTERKFDTVTVIVKEINKGVKIANTQINSSDAVSGKPMKVIYTKNSTIKLVYEKGKNYTIECTATGYKPFNHAMVVSEYVKADSNQFVIFMKPLKTGDNFVMDNIYFFPNTYALKDGSTEALTSLLNYLTNNPNVKIELQGHTNGNNKCKKNKNFKDEGPEWNFSGSAQKLSLMRAEEIKKYLVEHGANKDNISTIGFGGEKMIVANPKSPEAIKKNARVEVVIIEDGGL